jgi:segregation and condensation protein A
MEKKDIINENNIKINENMKNNLKKDENNIKINENMKNNLKKDENNIKINENMKNNLKKDENNITFQQEQVQDMLFNRKIDWQEIIYDLINTEQLNPWDINISLLTDKYLERVSKLEEADFFISSKVLLAASLLLRIKSEILLNKEIKRIDEILEDKKEIENDISLFEKIEFNEEIPELIQKSPLPRLKRVVLSELIESLNKAIKTENRRIQKEIIIKRARRENELFLPKQKISIKDRIKTIHIKIIDYFKKNNSEKIEFEEFFGKTKEEKISSFFPLLYLENNKKIWLEQNTFFGKINIWPHKNYFKHNKNYFKNLQEDLNKE